MRNLNLLADHIQHSIDFVEQCCQVNQDDHIWIYDLGKVFHLYCKSKRYKQPGNCHLMEALEALGYSNTSINHRNMVNVKLKRPLKF